MFNIFRDYNKFDYIIVLLIASLTFGGYGGALQLVRILAIIFFPLLLSHYYRCRDYASGIRNFLLCMFLYAVCSFLWTLDTVTGMKELLYLIVHSILFMELIVFARYANKPLESFSTGWLLFLICCLPVSAWELISGEHLSIAREADATISIGGNMLNRRFASHTYGDINAYNTILCFAVPWIYYRMMTISKTVKERMVDIVLILFPFIICVYNGTRGGTIAMGIMLAVYVLRSVKSVKNTIFLACMFIVAGLLISHYASDLFVVLEARDIQDTRTQVWLTAWKAIVNDGFLGSGIGGGQASMEQSVHGSIAVPHNAIIELCLVYGIGFTMAVLLYQYRMFMKSFRVYDLSIRYTLLLLFFSLPFSLLIHSHYLNQACLYVLLATQFVFARYPRIKRV